jgi:hypothetical protein
LTGRANGDGCGISWGRFEEEPAVYFSQFRKGRPLLRAITSSNSALAFNHLPPAWKICFASVYVNAMRLGSPYVVRCRVCRIARSSFPLSDDITRKKNMRREETGDSNVCSGEESLRHGDKTDTEGGARFNQGTGRWGDKILSTKQGSEVGPRWGGVGWGGVWGEISDRVTPHVVFCPCAFHLDPRSVACQVSRHRAPLYTVPNVVDAQANLVLLFLLRHSGGGVRGTPVGSNKRHTSCTQRVAYSRPKTLGSQPSAIFETRKCTHHLTPPSSTSTILNDPQRSSINLSTIKPTKIVL